MTGFLLELAQNCGEKRRFSGADRAHDRYETPPLHLQVDVAKSHLFLQGNRSKSSIIKCNDLTSYLAPFDYVQESKLHKCLKKYFFNVAIPMRWITSLFVSRHICISIYIK